uniref:Uncharacterized protein n=1 Tax=Ananas comosus var. bracteatus TaxID=296719 RepID=A0A6V7Q3P8_ANACO|nr:unnamed protein product [Ananas comosus var. bracteatus]
MLSEARSLSCFQIVFDVATFESSIGSVKLNLEYFEYSRLSLTEPIDDSKVAHRKRCGSTEGSQQQQQQEEAAAAAHGGSFLHCPFRQSSHASPGPIPSLGPCSYKEKLLPAPTAPHYL